MPQELNLNVNPYFDDFDRNKNYYKVLFKPTTPVQTRELTTLQSIFQNQIERFGSHFFKEGSKVIPGQLTYIKNFHAVQIDESFSSIPVSFYLNQLEGLTIYGKSSGIKAKIVKVIDSNESERKNITLYIEYIESATNDLSQKEFFDNEILLSESQIQFGNNFIPQGEGFANTIAINSTSIGSAFALSNGVYFLRGTFVEVEDQILILDQYTNEPSYRVGLLVNEEIVTSDDDITLTDNAQGFNNYSAPGADRLKITATLAKKELDDYNSASFVQLASVQNGILRDISNNTEYNILGDELAKRTFDESGHYYVKAFNTYCKESLNDELGNDGIFKAGELTYNGSVPNENLFVYKISPGKAYVKGYEVEYQSPVFLDSPKPRTTRTLENQFINFNFSSALTVNNVTGSPLIGFNTSSTISLRNERIGADALTSPGKEIGVARVYDFVLDQGGYDVSNLDLNKWNLSLFDIQTYSTLTLNEPITLSASTFIQGANTGATGFVKEAVSSASTITLYQVNGEFSEKEAIIIDNSDPSKNTRYINTINKYGISDIKSVFSTTGIGKTFSADTIQSDSIVLGISSITAASGGISTVTVSNFNISGVISVNNLIKYSQSGISTVFYAKVDSVNTTLNTFTLKPVSDVIGVINGSLPTTNISVNDLTLLTTKLQSDTNSGNISDDNSLYSILPKPNISSVDLSEAKITIRKQFVTNIVNNSTNPIDTDVDEVFLPFDEDRYILIRSDGSLEALTRDKLDFQNQNTRLVINNLGSNDTGSILIASIRKSNIKSKSKKKKIVESIIINKSVNSFSGVGQSTTNDGLTYGNYPYGTRVQDKEICLNYPDVGVLYGIFESTDISEPIIPFATVGSLDGPSSTTNDLIIGESIVGQTSGARAFYAERKSDTSIGFIYENDITFISGELINFRESNVTAVISSINSGSKNITKNYKLINGQTPTYYDYSRVLRTSEDSKPERKLKIVFSRRYYETSDTGDFTTVNSYNSFNYKTEISKISGYRATDLLDFRPRVTDYTVSEGSRSPFEFLGRTFNNSLHSSKDVISGSEPIEISYSYYLPRIDRIYLNKDKTFTIKYGIPSDNPTLPEEVSGSMNIANVYLPAYMFDVSDANIEFIQHKRYQMKDIFNLENRIKNLEYYSTLSLLETSTQNLFVDDGSGRGINRFKSGFYVDNFTSSLGQDSLNGVRNSIDITKGELRPSHYTSNLKLEIGNNTIAGIGSTTQENEDKRYSTIIGYNVKKTGDIVSLDYTDISWLNQPYSTRTENVTPFFVQLWEGNIELNPPTDVWIDTNRLQVNNINVEGSYLGITQAMGAEIKTTQDGKRIGVVPTVWNSWQTTGVDVFVTEKSSTTNTIKVENRTTKSLRQGNSTEFEKFLGRSAVNGVPTTFMVETETNTVNRISTPTTTTKSFLNTTERQKRTGVQYTINEEISTETLGDRVVSRSLITYMRSRNIEFTSRGMKPFTQLYAFFDGTNVTSYCFNKLIEIQMTSGTFQVGERVNGTLSNDPQLNKSKITFRVAKSNHKYGPYNNPTDIFTKNPYNRNTTIPSAYSSSSTILNVDTFSLSEEANASYFGLLKEGMILRGVTSGATAKVTSIRLVTDEIGTLIGSFYVPDGKSGTPQFETGRSRFRLTSSSTNSQIPGVVTSSSEETFYSQGQIDNVQQTTLSIRNAKVKVDSFSENRTVSNTTSLGTQTTVGQATVQSTSNTRLTGQYRDPLAQSFAVDDPNGIYVTKVDLYFRTKDTVLPVYIQIREVELGVPNKKILAFSEVECTPDKINVSENATIPTTITFPAPVYLEGGKEYALVIISDSNEYNVWISRLGEVDVTSMGQEQNQILVSTQNLLGSLFKSQNASTWTPSQYEDLKFTLYRANFVTSGFTQFFNSNLSEELESMTENPLYLESNKIRVSLSSSITNPSLTLGNTVIQQSVGLATAYGNLVGYAGSAYGTLNVISPGIGYTGSNYTFTGVALTSITGSGVNATANITINNGGVVASGATIVNGGSGYVIGDILEPVTIGSQNLGYGMKFSVSNISGNNELVIDNIQGEFGIDVVKFVNNSGVTTDFTNSGSPVSISNINVISYGNHIKVFHRNHGLHSSLNKVKISNIHSDIEPVLLSSAYPSASNVTNQIVVSDASSFTTFENIPVSLQNPGYVKINDEILSYTGVSGNTLTGVTRQIDGTKGFNYAVNSKVEKYELNYVSLRRINTIHDLSDVDTSIKNPIGADYYYIKVDMSSNGTDRSINTSNGKLKFNRTMTSGGVEGQATYNIPYEILIPNIKQATPKGTNIEYSSRTISGTSLSGSELSFVDKGTQNITNNSMNYFDAPRLIASKINESEYLDNLPGNKSIVINSNFVTSDPKISPIIDLTNNSITLISNRINNPVTDYSKDSTINTIIDDPNLFTYVTKPIVLENPATSLKVILDAYIHINSDVRVLYSIGENNNTFVPFPGYLNINPDNQTVIDQRNSNGSADSKMIRQDRFLNNPSSSDFLEYTFTANLLTSFKHYRIKLIGTSTNQAYVPIIRNLRVIALA